MFTQEMYLIELREKIDQLKEIGTHAMTGEQRHMFHNLRAEYNAIITGDDEYFEPNYDLLQLDVYQEKQYPLGNSRGYSDIDMLGPEDFR